MSVRNRNKGRLWPQLLRRALSCLIYLLDDMVGIIYAKCICLVINSTRISGKAACFLSQANQECCFALGLKVALLLTLSKKYHSALRFVRI